MISVIGVDPSITATGIADTAGNLYIAGGPSSLGDGRLTRIGDAIEIIAWRQAPDLAVIELLPQHMKAAGITGMVQGVIRDRLMRLGVEYVFVTPATLKKFATGRGNADKSDMRMALFQRAGIDERDDNKVDAAWLRYAGLQHYGQSAVQLPAAQVKALDVVEWPALAVAS